jgi:hypothetical protein
LSTTGVKLLAEASTKALKAILEAIRERAEYPASKLSDLTNTWQIDSYFVRFRARPFAIKEIAHPNDFT